MSVIVKGMEMPTSCASCRMAVCFADTGRAKCYATLSYIDPERGKRSYDCPLAELPEKHGPLIDCQALLEEAKRLSGPLTGDGWSNQGVFLLIARQPTIVEAEGE